MYRMPAEWAPHAATWLGWPHETTDWPGKFTPVPYLYGEIVRILPQRNAVRILMPRPDCSLTATSSASTASTWC